MILTLHKYIFRELMKVFLPAAVALTLILSLGSILQPMQEYGVGPRQAVNIMGYFLPITLTFILPIAALFAGALVYGRLAGDNELNACKASGISFLRLAFPGLALALIVAGANLLLSFHVTPIFVHLAEKSIKADAKQILFRNIQRRGYYELDRYLIYADYAEPRSDTLAGVVAVEIKDGRIERIFAADTAKVSFRSSRGSEYEVQIIARNPSQIGPENVGTGSAESVSLSSGFGSLLEDDVKFKRFDQMRNIEADLMQFAPIARMAREAYAQFVTELLAQDIRAKLSGEPNSFYTLPGEPSFVTLTADMCTVKDVKELELSGGVLIREYGSDDNKLLCALRCPKASLYVDGDERALTVTINIDNAREVSSGNFRMWYTIRGLKIPRDITGMPATGNTLQDIRPQLLSAALKDGPSPQLQGLNNELQRRIRKTLVEMKAEIHSRLAFGIGCVPMILIGIALGVIKKGGHMLSAFGASCVPAAVLIVCIISGKNITENLGSQAISGLLLMWAGLLLLAGLAVVMYIRLLKT